MNKNKGPGPVALLARSVLLVEDDPAAAGLLREMVRGVLPESMLHVAASLSQAHLMLLTVRPDIAIVNLNVSDGSAFDFVAAALQRTPPVLIIVNAVHGDDDRTLPALLAGAAGLLLKHDPPKAIERQLRDALSGVLPLSPSLARQLIRHFDWTRAGETLTGSELEVLTWVAAGDTLNQAAERMRTCISDVHDCVERVYRKAGVRPGPPAARRLPRTERSGGNNRGGAARETNP